MKSRFARTLLAALLTVALALAGEAATRLGSVYFESLDALQRQCALGAKLYEAPALETLPAMLPGKIPGGAGIDKGQPLALHFVDTGADTPGFVLEVVAAATPEAYLQSLVGEGVPLPAPAGGFYKLGDGTTAHISGKRLFLAPGMSAGGEGLVKSVVDAKTALPALPGAIRVTLVPSALIPKIEELGRSLDNLPATMPGADEQRAMMRAMLDFYKRILGQLDALHLGVAVQEEGLFIRTRIVPRAGTEIAAMVASMQPAQDAQLAFLDKSALLACASGRTVVPDPLKQEFIRIYTEMLAVSPAAKGMPASERATLMTQSLRTLGLPMAFACGLSPDGRALRVQSMMQMTNAAAYLDEHFAMLRKPVIRQLSGMTFSEPVVRTYQGARIFTCRSAMDEKSIEALMQSAAPGAAPGQLDTSLKQAMAFLRPVMQLFSNDLAYAATSDALVFGMGSPATVEQALATLRGKATPEAARIRAVLAASAAPCSLGRLSLAGVLRGILLNLPAGDGGQGDLMAAAAMAAVAATPEGEGIVFAGWRANQELLSALHVPPSEVKALKAQIPALIMRSRR